MSTRRPTISRPSPGRKAPVGSKVAEQAVKSSVMDSAKQQIQFKMDKTQPVEMPADRDLSPRSKRRLEQQYEEIAEKDDLEVSAWQRQLRVNAFMLNIGVRKMISKNLVPVYDAQAAINDSIKQKLNFNIRKLEDRVKSLEVAVYGNKGDPEDAFT